MRIIVKIVAGFAAICISHVHAQQVNTKVDFCASTISGNSAVAMYAKDKGAFADYGLDVNLVFIEGGSKAVTTLISGDMDFCLISGRPVVNAVLAGVDLTIVAGLYNSHLYSLMVQSEIQSPADLKGKILAISRPGSSSDAAVRKLLEEMRLVPDRDVAILAVGGQSSRLAAMQRGEIAGTLVGIPNTIEAKALGFTELVNMSQSNVPFLHTGIATSRDYISQHRATALAFMEAIVDTIARMKADREGVKEVVAKYLLLDMEQDAAALDEVYEVLVLGYLQDIPYAKEAAIDFELEKAKEKNVHAAKFTSKDIIDQSILADIEAKRSKNKQE